MSNESAILKLSFNIINLKIRIEKVSIANHLWSEIFLLFTRASNDIIVISNNILELYWFEFRRIIQQFAQYITKAKINVLYDDISKKLIFEHIDDLNSLNSVIKGNFPQIDDINIFLKKGNFHRTLTQEQLRNTKHLLALKHGANFSVPGAGKTTTLLAVYTVLKMKNIINKLLVVGPRNAFISWEDEIHECFINDSPKITRLTGGKDKISNLLQENPEVSLITYHQLPIVIHDILFFLQRNHIHLVLDESHRIKKGLPGIHFLSSIRIADFSTRRDILTGTPMPQSTSDIESQLDFLWPGSNIMLKAKYIIDDNQRLEAINNILKPLYVRTTKSELGLNPLEIKITDIDLGPVQFELYELLRSESARILSGMKRRDIQAFRNIGKQVVRLLQTASNPMLITSDDSYNQDINEMPEGIKKWEILTEFSKYEKPAKIEYVIKRVNELISKGQKVVLWSVFVKNILLLERELSELGAISIYGGIETGDESLSETREGRIRRFHEDPNCKVMIGNPAACGEGISLHKICHNAIYLDRTFNAAHYLQSVDRIHRLGLEKDVITSVEIVQAKDTIDMVVDGRLREKIDAMGHVLDDSYLRKLAYDPEDIIEDIPGGVDQKDIHEIEKHMKGGE